MVALAVLLSGTLLSPVFAQKNRSGEKFYRPNSSMHGKTVLIPMGITFEGRIDSTIGSSVSRQGERFTVTLSAPLLGNGTDVLVPAGSQVIGEVVEAIPASSIPRVKGMPKPTGKLRVQLSGLRTPDGVTYPVIASMVGEQMVMGRRTTMNKNLGPGIAYVGSQSSFEAVAPGANARNIPGQGPRVMKKRELLTDAIYGVDKQMDSRADQMRVRSLVKRNQNLYIMDGSPITMRFDAPFKMGISAAQGSETMLEETYDNEGERPAGGRRFEPTSQPTARKEKDADVQQQQQQQQSPLPFLRPKTEAAYPNAAPGGVPGFIPGAGGQPPAAPYGQPVGQPQAQPVQPSAQPGTNF